MSIALTSHHSTRWKFSKYFYSGCFKQLSLRKSIFLFWPESTLWGRVARSRIRCCGCSPTYSAPTWEPTGTWYWPWHWQSRQYMGTLGVRGYPSIGDGHMPILCSYLGTHGYIQDGDVGAQMIKLTKILNINLKRPCLQCKMLKIIWNIPFRNWQLKDQCIRLSVLKTFKWFEKVRFSQDCSTFHEWGGWDKYSLTMIALDVAKVLEAILLGKLAHYEPAFYLI